MSEVDDKIRVWAAALVVEPQRNTHAQLALLETFAELYGQDSIWAKRVLQWHDGVRYFPPIESR